MTKPLLDTARCYAERFRWSIIAIRSRTKNRPVGKWKQYQSCPADELQLRKWFAHGTANNMAVVLGKVSDGLVCRDFDTMEAFEAWAGAHPDLAKTLPTVATARGRHVYFRTGAENLFFVDLRDLDPPEDGEYRGDSGHYCMLPPSRHPDGPVYHWLIPPNVEIPFVADVRASGILPQNAAHVTETTNQTERTEGTEVTEVTKNTEAIEGGVVEVFAPTCPSNGSVTSVLSVTRPHAIADDELEHAILRNIPLGIGRRHRQVFQLARSLKAILHLADAPVDDVKPYVRRWHKIGLERGVIGTEPFEETWIDFLKAWPRVKFPSGNEPMAAILQRAMESPPSEVAKNYDCEGVRLLVAICRELQSASDDKAFFLACRTAARLLGLKTMRKVGGVLQEADDQVKAWRWLGLLVHDRILKEVEHGQPGKGRASRYRYIGGDH